MTRESGIRAFGVLCLVVALAASAGCGKSAPPSSVTGAAPASSVSDGPTSKPYSDAELLVVFGQGAGKEAVAVATVEDMSRLRDIVSLKSDPRDRQDAGWAAMLFLGETRSADGKASTYWSDIQTSPQTKKSMSAVVANINAMLATKDSSEVKRASREIIAANADYNDRLQNVAFAFYAYTYMFYESGKDAEFDGELNSYLSGLMNKYPSRTAN